MKYPLETRPKYSIKAAHYRPLHGNSTQPANSWGIGDSGVWGVGFGRHLGRPTPPKSPILQKKEVLYPLRPSGYRTFDLVDILVDRDGRWPLCGSNGAADHARKVQPYSSRSSTSYSASSVLQPWGFCRIKFHTPTPISPYAATRRSRASQLRQSSNQT